MQILRFEMAGLKDFHYHKNNRLVDILEQTKHINDLHRINDNHLDEQKWKRMNVI